MENIQEKSLDEYYNEYCIKVCDSISEKLRSEEFQKEITKSVDSYLENEFTPFLNNLFKEVCNNGK